MKATVNPRTPAVEREPPEATKIIIADDHPTFLLGLKQVISMDETFVVIGEAGDGKAGLEMIRNQRPELAVIDWDMPALNGLELMKLIRLSHLPTRIVLLTMHSNERLVNEAMETGVSGYVLKDNAIQDILECLRTVRCGDIFLSSAVAHYVYKRSWRRTHLHQAKPGLETLTLMERRVLSMVSKGRTNKEIAADLSISPRTVETHRRNICEKLGLRGSHSLMQFALENRDLL